MIFLNNPEHGRRIAARSGTTYEPIDGVLSRGVGDELYGGVLYKGYNRHSVSMHFAGFRRGWATPDLIYGGFDYPFAKLGCVKVFASIPETNLRALRVAHKLGFKPQAYVSGVFADGGLIVMGMERDQCRWLRRRSFDVAE